MKRMAAFFLALAFPLAQAADFMGVRIAEERRCSPYNADEYPYPQSVELDIIRRMGGAIYGPYEARCFEHRGQTDIEHMVAKAEAHDSGMCARSAEERARFSRDIANLTLASPKVNRQEKVAKDLSEWLPKRNKCWFVATVVAVKKKWGLTMDQREAAAARRVLANCRSYGMEAPPPKNC